MKRRTFLASATASSLIARSATAADGPAPLLRFGLITDAQYADADPKGERHYRETPGKLKSAVETIRAAKPSFTLHLGDFIDRDFKAFATLLPLLDGLGHPVHHLLGNHDYDVAFSGSLQQSRLRRACPRPRNKATEKGKDSSYRSGRH